MAATADFTFFGPVASPGTVIDRLPAFDPTSSKSGRVRVGGFNTLVNSMQSYPCDISTPLGFGVVFAFSSFPGSPTSLVSLGDPTLKYELIVDNAGLLTFQVTDTGGISQITKPTAITLGAAHFVSCLYRYAGGAGNKSDYMELYLNGFYVGTTIGTDTAATTFLSSINSSTATFISTSGCQMQLAYFNNDNGGSTAINAMPLYGVTASKGTSVSQSAQAMQQFASITVPTSIKATSTSSITGDPHFSGFEGEWYSVHGKEGHIYNLLTDDHIQVNARFCEWPTSGDAHMTAMDYIGISLLHPWGDIIETVDVHAREGIMVNDRRVSLPIDTRQARVRRVGWEAVKDYSGREGFGTFLEAFAVETSQYVVYIVRATDHVNPLYVNVIVELKDLLRRPHGIIGQTADFDGLPRTMDGSEDDYEVSTLRSSDFAYNKFLG